MVNSNTLLLDVWAAINRNISNMKDFRSKPQWPKSRERPCSYNGKVVRMEWGAKSNSPMLPKIEKYSCLIRASMAQLQLRVFNSHRIYSIQKRLVINYNKSQMVLLDNLLQVHKPS